MAWFSNDKEVPNVAPLERINFNKDMECLLFMIDNEISNIKLSISNIVTTNKNKIFYSADIEEFVLTGGKAVLGSLSDEYLNSLIRYLKVEEGIIKFICDYIFRNVFTWTIQQNINIIHGEKTSTEINENIKNNITTNNDM